MNIQETYGAITKISKLYKIDIKRINFQSETSEQKIEDKTSYSRVRNTKKLLKEGDKNPKNYSFSEGRFY